MNIKKDRLLGLIILAIGLLVILGAISLPSSNLANDPGPAIFPIFGAILMIGGSLSIIVRKQEQAKPFLSHEQWKRLWILFAIFIGYAIGLWLIGFIISTFLILLILNILFSEGDKISLWKRLVFSIIVTVLIYFLFETGLSLLLPDGLLFS